MMIILKKLNRGQNEPNMKLAKRNSQSFRETAVTLYQ